VGPEGPSPGLLQGVSHSAVESSGKFDALSMFRYFVVSYFRRERYETAKLPKLEAIGFLSKSFLFLNLVCLKIIEKRISYQSVQTELTYSKPWISFVV